MAEAGPTYGPAPTDQPTNRTMVQTYIGGYVDTGTIPTTYISIRVTTPHDNWPAIEKLVSDAEWYISYPHSGKNGNNEHFHVFVSGGTATTREKFRKRFKTAGFVGNKCVSVKLFENGITSAISYGAREGTTPYVKGSECARWIAEAPEWVESRAGKKRRATDEYVELSCKNLMKLAFEWRRTEGLSSTHLPYVIECMLNTGFYIMSPTLMRQGAPLWMVPLFQHSCEVGVLQWKHNIWESGVFRDFNR